MAVVCQGCNSGMASAFDRRAKFSAAARDQDAAAYGDDPMNKTLTVALSALLLASTAAPSFAQSYEDRAYQDQMREYERQRAIYDQQRADYDRRYGPQANRYDDRGPSSQRPEGYRRYVNDVCESRSKAKSNNRATGTVLGALIGGALGYNVAAKKNQGEGTVLGAVVGGAIGNSIGANASTDDRYAPQCDARGYYYSYEQTTDYRESDDYRGRRSGRYDAGYYQRQRCRLAPAPMDDNGRTEYRYVRVCPDRNNHYRITG